MKLRLTGRILPLFSLILIGVLLAGTKTAWSSGLLRINMADGTSVEVPYYWEEGGEVKFEIPGGIAGVPRAQVTSVDEIIAAREFDPEALLAAPEAATNPEKQRVLEELASAKSPSAKAGEKLSTEEGLKALRTDGLSRPGSRSDRVSAPMFNLEGDFTELIRLQGSGVSVIMHNVLSSQTDLRGKGITLALYDGEGKVLQRKPCEVYELDADQATMRKLGVHGRLFSVIASVKPDPKIKKYEIVTGY